MESNITRWRFSGFFGKLWHRVTFYIYLFTVALVTIVLMPLFAVLRGIVDGLRVCWRVVGSPARDIRVNTGEHDE